VDWAQDDGIREHRGTMSIAQTPLPLADIPVIDITPPRGWLELKLRDLWQFRELAYFFVWRAKGRFCGLQPVVAHTENS